MGRGPQVYLHGVDSDGRPCASVIVPSRVAAYLERYAGLDAFRREHRGADCDVDDVLIALHQAALSWRGAATGTRQPAQPEPGTGLNYFSTTQAASLLGITVRAVTRAATEGRLGAEKPDGIRWRISREALEHFKAAHAARS